MTVNPPPSSSQSVMDQRQPSSSGKGKARAVQQDPANPSSSLASRVLSSVSKLTQDVVSAPGGDLTQSLVSSSAASNKVQPSTSSNGRSIESLETRYHGSPLSGGGSSFQQPHGLDMFRSQSNDTSTAEQFEDFVTSGHGRIHKITGIENRGDLPIRHDGPQEEASWSSEFLGRDSNSMYDPFPMDGGEVVKLLSDPSFVAMTDVYDTVDATPDGVSDLFSLNLGTDIEKTAAKNIRSALPSPPQHGTVAADNAMNLIPSFETFVGDGKLEHGQKSPGLLASTPDRERWFAEWNDVLNGYTDEVWGNLLPVVKDARQEMEEVKTGAKDLDMKALVRLRMIVGHIQAEQSTSHLNQYDAASIEQQDAMHHQHIHQESRLRPQDYSVAGQGSASDVLQEQAPQVHHRREEESELPGPDFHCPWYSCHESFNNMRELRRHSQTHAHGQYPCPHVTCREGFAERAEWAKHISIAHHDLVRARGDGWFDYEE
jgi:hypothetical protein